MSTTEIPTGLDDEKFSFAKEFPKKKTTRPIVRNSCPQVGMAVDIRSAALPKSGPLGHQGWNVCIHFRRKTHGD